jgi:hypothetical protein
MDNANSPSDMYENREIQGSWNQCSSGVYFVRKFSST